MNNKFAVRGGSGDTTVVDKTARPQDNLYLAVNSDYLDQLEIPADRSRMGSFDQIAENVEKSLMADFAAFASGEKEVPTSWPRTLTSGTLTGQNQSRLTCINWKD